MNCEEDAKAIPEKENKQAQSDEGMGDEYVEGVEISLTINDYNYYMLGVDKSDQLVAYYRPILQFRRTWMPMMLQASNLTWSNAYVSYYTLKGGDSV